MLSCLLLTLRVLSIEVKHVKQKPIALMMVALLTLSAVGAVSVITATKTVAVTATPTTLRIELLTQTPKPNQAQIVDVRLWSGTYAVGDKTVKLYAKNLANNTIMYLGSVITYKADGAAAKSVKLPAGTYYVYATFAGSGGTTPYVASTSQMVLFKVATTAPAKKPTNIYIWTGAPHQKTTVGTSFVLDAGFFNGSTPLSNKNLMIAYMYKAPASTLWNSPKIITKIGSDSGFPMHLWKAPAQGSYRFYFVFSGDSKYYASKSNYVDVIVS